MNPFPPFLRPSVPAELHPSLLPSPRNRQARRPPAHPQLRWIPWGWSLVCAGLIGLTVVVEAQDRLKQMPGYERYTQMAKEIPGSWKSGALSVTWAEDSRSFEFRRDGKRFRFELAAMQATEITNGANAARPHTRSTRYPSLSIVDKFAQERESL